MRLTDITQQKELNRRAAAHLAYAVASDSYFTDEATAEMRRRGFGAYSTHVKAAVDAMTVEDTGIALAPLSSATLAQTVSASLLGKLDGAQQFALTDFLRVQTARIDGFIVEEGASKPVSRVDFSTAGPPIKSTAQIVLTSEFLKVTDEATQQSLTAQLTGAAAAALDAAVLTAMQTAATAPEASADPGVLLAALVNPARPALVGAWDAIAPLAGTLTDLQRLGVQVVISPAAAGFLYAVDAARLAVALSAPIVQVARDALVTLDDGGSPSSTTVLNLWTQNAVALRSEIWARLAVAPGAVAYGAV